MKKSILTVAFTTSILLSSCSNSAEKVETAKENVTVQYNLPLGKGGTLSVYNTLGEKIYEFAIVPGTKKTEINTSLLARGVYTCRLVTSEGIAVKKFLKE